MRPPEWGPLELTETRQAPKVAPKPARFGETSRANAGQPHVKNPRISKGFIAFPGCFGKAALERVKGIEPSSSAWEAAALPLSYTREPAHLAFAGLGRRGQSVMLGQTLPFSTSPV